MKKIILLLLLTILNKYNVDCNWRSYNLIIKNITTEYRNPDYFAAVDFKVNNGESVISFDIWLDIIKDLDKLVYIRMEGFERKDGVFVPSLINSTMELCSYYRHPMSNPLLHIFYPSLTKNGNFAKSCPIRKAKYGATNVLIEQDKLPPYVPGDHWRFVISLLHDKVLTMACTAHIKVDHSRALDGLKLLNYGK